MKLKATSLLSLCAITVSSLLLTMSCKKSNGPTGAAAQLSATVGANSFQPVLVVAIDNAAHIGIAALQVTNGDSLYMTVFVPDTAKAGKAVAFSMYGDAAVTYSNSKGTIVYSSVEQSAHGTITVSSFDKSNKKVAGNFSGVIYSSLPNSHDSLKVNGQFNTSYN
jgi:hypothetical protein